MSTPLATQINSSTRIMANNLSQILARRGRNKYGNKRIGSHASKKEHYRSLQLQNMQRSGLISCLREQVPFELIPAFTYDDGTREHAVRYIADFVYVDNASGQTIVEDTKGFRTREYIIKRKLMHFIHGIRISEI